MEREVELDFFNDEYISFDDIKKFIKSEEERLEKVSKQHRPRLTQIKYYLKLLQGLYDSAIYTNKLADQVADQLKYQTSLAKKYRSNMKNGIMPCHIRFKLGPLVILK